MLRAETGGADMELAEWWGKYQEASENDQRKMTQPPRKAAGGKASTRKRGYRPRVKKTTPGNDA